MLRRTFYKNNSICSFFFFFGNLKWKTLSNGFNFFGTCLQNYILERIFLVSLEVHLQNVKSYDALWLKKSIINMGISFFEMFVSFVFPIYLKGILKYLLGVKGRKSCWFLSLGLWVFLLKELMGSYFWNSFWFMFTYIRIKEEINLDFIEIFISLVFLWVHDLLWIVVNFPSFYILLKHNWGCGGARS
jgi:hypothetical protein